MYGPASSQQGGQPGNGSSYPRIISVSQTESAYGSTLGGGGKRDAREPKERIATPRGQMSASKDSKPSLAAVDGPLKDFFSEKSPLAKLTPLPSKKNSAFYSGIATLVGEFEKTKPPAPRFPIDLEEMRKARRIDKILNNEKVLEGRKKEYKLPDENIATKEAYNTLFLAKLNDSLTSDNLKSLMEQFGEVVYLRLVTDLDGKSKHYAFVEFKREEDMKAAYFQVKQEGLGEEREKVIVDVERGRTTANWKPMKLGGGLGGRVLRKSRKDFKYEKFEKLLAEKKLAASGVSVYGSGRGAADRGGSGAGWSDRGRGRDGRDSGGGYRRDDRGDNRGRGGDKGGYDRGGYDRGDHDRGRGYGRGDRGGGGYRDSGRDGYRDRDRDRDRDNKGFGQGKSASMYGGGGGGGAGGGDRRDRSRSRDRDRGGYGGYR